MPWTPQTTDPSTDGNALPSSRREVPSYTRKSKKYAWYACLSYVYKQTHQELGSTPGTLLQLNRAPLFPSDPLNAGSAPEAPLLTPTD